MKFTIDIEPRSDVDEIRNTLEILNRKTKFENFSNYFTKAITDIKWSYNNPLFEGCRYYGNSGKFSVYKRLLNVLKEVYGKITLQYQIYKSDKDLPSLANKVMHTTVFLHYEQYNNKKKCYTSLCNPLRKCHTKTRNPNLVTCNVCQKLLTTKIKTN